MGSIIFCHQEKTVSRVEQAHDDYVSVRQDSRFYNYTKHKGNTELEVIGKAGRFNQLDFIQPWRYVYHQMLRL